MQVNFARQRIPSISREGQTEREAKLLERPATKHVFIINGRGGVGKDTVCSIAGRFWHVQTVSSITPILTVARAAGWDGKKTIEARRFLSDLKQLCTSFNDLSFRYCMTQYQRFQESQDEILFVHIREPEEIARFQQAVGDDCHTILIRRPAWEETLQKFGNTSDDNVEAFSYDGILVLQKPRDTMPEQVHAFFESFLSESNS